MEKLTLNQKQLVLAKLRALKQSPEMLKKYDRDGDGVVSAEEWEAARRDVVREVLRSDRTPLFEVAPILQESNRTAFLGWMYDNREKISAACIILGGIMIVIDPGTFAERGEAPFEWGEAGLGGQLTLIQHWLNWTSSGWTGFVMIVFGAIWSRYARYFIN